jgi:TonB-linked SusC/RagA family outer membrane protein
MRKPIYFLATLFFLVLTAGAQTRQLSGKITDVKTGTPLVGASVSADGKSIGTTTANGSFTVTVPAKAKSLTVSFLGYETQTVKLTASTTLNVELATSEQLLSEVVVTGYQTIQKKQTVGALSVVKSETIRNVPIGSFDQILQGQSSGLLVQSNSGQPGASASVVIRGKGSVNGTTDPLYIMDGIQISSSNFSSLNPNDFESVTVLKDAATTAVYGSRGANGVIVITSKKGKAGKTLFEYNGQYGQSEFPENKLVLMNSAQKIDYELARGNPYGWSTAVADSLRKVNTVWQDLLTQTGITNTHQFSARGGNEKTVFYMSGAVFNQTGTVQKTALKRYTGRVNLEHTSGILKLGINTSGGWSDYANTSESNTGIATPLNAIRWGNPYETPYTKTGAYQKFVSGQPNPIQELNEQDRGTKEVKIVANAFADLKLPFLTGLSFRTNWGVDYENWDQTTLFTRFGVTGQSAQGLNGSYNKNTRINTRFTGTNSFNYTNKFGDHGITGGLYNEFIQTQTSNFGYTGFGLTGNFQNGAGITPGSPTNGYIPSVNEGKTKSALISYFATAAYSYKNKIFINGSFRVDGSSRFGANSRYANFYTVGGAYAISDEDYFQKSSFLKFIDNLKFRISYGTSGNQEGIGSFASRELFTNRTYDGVSGPGLSQLPNPDLVWEQRSKFNVGLDITMLKGRVNASVDYYTDVTDSLFLNTQLSRTQGFSSLNANIGKLGNKGWEFNLTTENIKTRSFSWTTTINFTINRNKFIALTPTTPATGIAGGTTIQRVGYPLNSNFLVKYLGVNPANGNSIYEKPDGTTTETYSDNDKQIIGVRDAPYFGGFTNTFKYANFELGVFFSFLFGNKIYNNDRSNVENPTYYGDNMALLVASEWRKAGDITDIPRASQTFRSATTHFLEDGSFIRLRNVQLSYDLPITALKKMKMNNARIYVSGQNLWTGFKFLGFDPEVSGGGLTGAQYPALRTVTVGLTVGF